MVICFTSYRSLGCTFLDWSFNWLAGHKEYWFDEQSKWIKLVKNPLTKSLAGAIDDVSPFHNAHGYKKNHPKGTEEWLKMTEKFIKMSARAQPLTYYGSSMGQSEDEYFKSINAVLKTGITVIFVRCDNIHPKQNRRTDPSMKESRTIRDEAMKEKILSKFISVKDLKNKIKNTTNMREFLTMNLKHLTSGPDRKIDKIFPNLLLLNYKSLILEGEKTVRNIFKFLNIEILEERYLSWLKIYKEWRKVAYSDVLFYENLSEITHCIRNGLPHSLKPYRLDTLKEAVIQNSLMITHKDRLIFHCLEKFPDNTLKLTPYLKSKKQY